MIKVTFVSAVLIAAAAFTTQALAARSKLRLPRRSTDPRMDGIINPLVP